MMRVISGFPYLNSLSLKLKKQLLLAQAAQGRLPCSGLVAGIFLPQEGVWRQLKVDHWR